MADAVQFKACTFTGVTQGSSGHPIRAINSITSAPIDINGDNTTVYLAGSGLTVTLTSSNDWGVSGTQISGYASSVSVSSTGNSASFTTTQTQALSANLSASGGTTTLTANSVLAFTLVGIVGHFDGSELSVNCTGCTSADCSAFTTSGTDFYNFTLGCAAPIIAGSINNGGGGGDTWIGPFSAAFVDALFIAYDMGASANAVLTTGGTSAAPTSASLSARNDLIANGCTITTN